MIVIIATVFPDLDSLSDVISHCKNQTGGGAEIEWMNSNSFVI